MSHQRRGGIAERNHSLGADPWSPDFPGGSRKRRRVRPAQIGKCPTQREDNHCGQSPEQPWRQGPVTFRNRLNSTFRSCLKFFLPTEYRNVTSDRHLNPDGMVRAFVSVVLLQLLAHCVRVPAYYRVFAWIVVAAAPENFAAD